MKLNSPRRLVLEDYPNKYRDLTSKLVGSLNEFMEEVYQGFNKRLNYNDNFEAFTTEVVITAGQPVRVRNTLNAAIKGTTIVRVDPLTISNEILTIAPFAQFTNGTNQIIINNITGLVAGRSYRVAMIFYS